MVNFRNVGWEKIINKKFDAYKYHYSNYEIHNKM